MNRILVLIRMYFYTIMMIELTPLLRPIQQSDEETITALCGIRGLFTTP